MKIRTRLFLLALSVTMVATNAHAHFLWLKLVPKTDIVDARMFFSEAANQEDYHLPEKIVSAKVWHKNVDGERTQLTLQEADDAEALHKNLAGDTSCAISTTCTYGNYHGSLLTYYSKSIYPQTLADLSKVGSDKQQRLDISVTWKNDRLHLALNWDGQPRPNTEFTVTAPSGEQQQIHARDTGMVEFVPEETGIYGVLAHFEDKEAAGEFDGKPFKGAHHYATLTIHLKGQQALSTPASADGNTATFPDLKEAISSFGAAVLDDHLYVYSGHTGRAHAHSSNNLSKHFRRLNLTNPQTGWESLPMQTPLQGVPLVAHGKYLYRIGGLNARNETTDEDADLHSVDTASRFDVEKQQWEDLPHLPRGRSSHDAIVHRDHLYVVGGWTLAGDSDGEWCNSMLTMDLTAEQPSWSSIPDLPFQKRALAVAAWGDSIYALCGMDQFQTVDRTVYRFDTQSKQWEKGPSLKGEGWMDSGYQPGAAKPDFLCLATTAYSIDFPTMDRRGKRLENLLLGVFSIACFRSTTNN